ncbi:MAG: TIGR03936 family radical SAM-associated protein [Anaerolineae bacterium]|nr:TIGR03936 family radical SAM-associated protein [Anaerolineae bacterium]MDW8101034.1 TIGR03936 family radical SAM-associated protein [Anaerolineae bacterium]
MQRLRLTFSHGESLRWISHLDVVRLWERTLRRAGLPVAYTRGYNPQLRIQFAAALPTGCFGRAEVADLWMEKAMPPQEVATRIRAELPSGIELLDVQEVDLQLPSLQALLRAADWRVAVDAADLPWEELEQRVRRILAADRLPRDRRRQPEQPARPYDLRPLIESLWLEGRDRDGWPVLWMRLRAEPGATGRPDEVLDALGLGQRPNRMERIALHFAEPNPKPAAQRPSEGPPSERG